MRRRRVRRVYLTMPLGRGTCGGGYGVGKTVHGGVVKIDAVRPISTSTQA